MLHEVPDPAGEENSMKTRANVRTRLDALSVTLAVSAGGLFAVLIGLLATR